MDQIFVTFHIHTTCILGREFAPEFTEDQQTLEQVHHREYTTCRDNIVFQSLFFSPWLAGWFHNFELTQNRKKATRIGLMYVMTTCL
jgi:hypothetical protein